MVDHNKERKEEKILNGKCVSLTNERNEEEVFKWLTEKEFTEIIHWPSSNSLQFGSALIFDFSSISLQFLFCLISRNDIMFFMKYKTNRNIVYSYKYHVVWCSKYRRIENQKNV